MNDSLLIIAGEASGDLHGSALIRELLNLKPELKIFGIGGNRMVSEGLNAMYGIESFAFLGFAEVIKHIPFIKKVQKEILNKVKAEKTSTAVLIDYPGFNLSLAKKLKALGLKIIYYISPQIWAWGKGRIKKIKRLVDHMIVVFPFEKEMYGHAGVRSSFVGHPLVERLKVYDYQSEKEFREKYNIDKDILLLMPGSRKHEIEKIFPQTLKAANKISEDQNLQIVIACSDNIDENLLQSFIKEKDVNVIKGKTYELMKYSKFGIIKSGTSTLEAGLSGLPYVVVYSTSRITYEIMKRLIKIKNIAIVNIILGRTIIKELIQDDVNCEKITAEVNGILSSEKNLLRIKAGLSELREILGEKNASAEAAKIIIDEAENAKAA